MVQDNAGKAFELTSSIQRTVFYCCQTTLYPVLQVDHSRKVSTAKCSYHAPLVPSQFQPDLQNVHAKCLGK